MNSFEAALSDGDTVTLERLLQANPSLARNVLDTKDPPLILAVSLGKHDVVRLLLRFGADANAHADSGASGWECAVSAAVWDGDLDMLQIFLDAGQDVNTKFRDGSTALFVAAMGSLRAMDRLLNAGAEVNARDVKGKTPLMCAADALESDSSEPALCRVARLLAAEADASVSTVDGVSVAQIAARQLEHPEIGLLLKRCLA